MMASTGCSRRYCFRNLTEGRIHRQRGSGTKTLALIQRERRIIGDLGPTALMGLTAPESTDTVAESFCAFPGYSEVFPGFFDDDFPLLFPVRALNTAYGSRMGRLMTSASGTMSLSSDSSVMPASGFSGV